MLRSVVAWGWFTTFYKPGEWVNGRNLFVFDTYENAERFKNDMSKGEDTPLEIWKCETGPIRRADRIPLADFMMCSFDKLWEVLDANAPPGTCLTDKVKLNGNDL